MWHMINQVNRWIEGSTATSITMTPSRGNEGRTKHTNTQHLQRDNLAIRKKLSKLLPCWHVVGHSTLSATAKKITSRGKAFAREGQKNNDNSLPPHHRVMIQKITHEQHLFRSSATTPYRGPSMHSPIIKRQIPCSCWHLHVPRGLPSFCLTRRPKCL